MRAGSNAEFRDAVAVAAALHARDELFSKHIEPEPAPEDPVEWAMADASDDPVPCNVRVVWTWLDSGIVATRPRGATTFLGSIGRCSDPLEFGQ